MAGLIEFSKSKYRSNDAVQDHKVVIFNLYPFRNFKFHGTGEIPHAGGGDLCAVGINCLRAGIY